MIILNYTKVKCTLRDKTVSYLMVEKIHQEDIKILIWYKWNHSVSKYIKKKSKEVDVRGENDQTPRGILAHLSSKVTSQADNK